MERFSRSHCKCSDLMLNSYIYTSLITIVVLLQLLVLVYNTELKIVQHPTLDVCEGDSIAGYVGWKRETIITSLLHEVKTIIMLEYCLSLYLHYREMISDFQMD